MLCSSPLPEWERIEGEGPITARFFRARFKILPFFLMSDRWERARVARAECIRSNHRAAEKDLGAGR